ncbi:MAG: hypothetical protein M3R55_17980, partial [Acidobacteriota bacterium]|nr:hypothetical protein [Acidobacteriota bacterium]
AASAGGRRIVIAIDNDSFRAGSEGPLRQAVNGLIAELTPRDQMLLITMPYGGIKVPFTTDHARIRTALSTTSGQRAQNETGSEMACRTRRLLESLGGFLNSLVVTETPATVIFFTAGMAAPRLDAIQGRAPGMCQLETRKFQEVGTAAAAARANFYVVFPDDLPRTGNSLGQGSIGSDNPIEGIEHLAGSTGGRRMPLLAVGSNALAQVARDSSAYYVAEIEPERADVDGQPRRLEVRVSRPGVTVQARTSITFAAPPPSGPKGSTPTAHQMLLVTDEFGELPLRVSGFTMRGEGDKVKVIAVAEPGDPSTILATAAMALVDSGGRVIAQATATDAAEVPLATAMLVPPGTYRLRVAATDKSGRYGAADVQVTAGLTAAGPLQLSGLVLGLSRNGTLRPRLEFTNEPLAIVSFEIYGASAAMTLSAGIEVARTADGPAIVASRLAIERGEGDRLVATGSVPIGALPAGDYLVRGIVGVDGGATATVVRTLRKR